MQRGFLLLLKPSQPGPALIPSHVWTREQPKAWHFPQEPRVYLVAHLSVSQHFFSHHSCFTPYTPPTQSPATTLHIPLHSSTGMPLYPSILPSICSLILPFFLSASLVFPLSLVEAPHSAASSPLHTSNQAEADAHHQPSPVTCHAVCAAESLVFLAAASPSNDSNSSSVIPSAGVVAQSNKYSPC